MTRTEMSDLRESASMQNWGKAHGGGGGGRRWRWEVDICLLSLEFHYLLALCFIIEKFIALHKAGNYKIHPLQVCSLFSSIHTHDCPPTPAPYQIVTIKSFCDMPNFDGAVL